jgi:hypothetical protein
LWTTAPLKTANVTWAIPTFSDNVNLVSTTVSRVPGVFAAGTYTVTASAIDTSGNQAACSFTFVVLTDTLPPNVTCPSSQTVSTAAGRNTAVVSWPTPFMSDNRGIATVQYSPSIYLPGASFPLGSTAMTLVVIDTYANVKACAFRIVVQDTEKPVVTCASSLNVTIPDGQTSTAVNWQPPFARDNVNISKFIQSHMAGSVFTAGVYNITTFANDTSGNIAKPCEFTLTVIGSSTVVGASVSDAAATSAAAGAGASVGVIVLIVIVLFVVYKRQQRRMQLMEEQYGNFDMSDEAVLARAQVTD